MADQYKNGYEVAKNIIETFGAVLAPIEMADFAAGFDDYMQEYLGYKDADEDEGIQQYIPANSGRVMILQLADGLVNEFSDEFPFDPDTETMPKPLSYWYAEGISPETTGAEWEWYAEYRYLEIKAAYNFIRETWLPLLPELNW